MWCRVPRPVDPRFPAAVRRRREQRGLSLRELARLAHVDPGHLSRIEAGKRPPTGELAAALDGALQAGGQLAALAAVNEVLTEHDAGRLAYVARHPRRIDPTTVDSLAAVLAHQRRLEDAIGAAAMRGPVLAQLATVEDLVTEARGPVRAPLVDVAAQWAQFAGWLHAASGQGKRARGWYGRALEWATEVDDPDMIATALNLRGHLAWLAGQPGPVIGLSAAAGRLPARPGVRALAAQQQARGHALVGEAADVDRMLDLAAELAAAAAERPGEEPPWIYFYNGGYLAMQRGLAYRLLGRRDRAIEELRAGLASMPAEVRRSEWVTRYVLELARAHEEAGDHDEAARLREEAGA
jgi:transcriptional regulator with XRE-family HTH domain